MKDFAKNELKVLAQYFFIALLAGWLDFTIWTSRIPGLNLHEAWLNYAPVLRRWQAIFIALSAIRLIFVFLLRKLNAHS
ncbi:MAG TPA: hypothetical protein VGO96_09075 [Pyrinomonadaceae bacterium]|jgi:hypothetical protein|nr:hypothetical protein [Pyrinomonadaceae bacterium]